jgi:FlaA1/EpsC-like NDP-sugar epimerase
MAHGAGKRVVITGATCTIGSAVISVQLEPALRDVLTAA